VFASRLPISLFLQVVREHDHGDPPIAESNANGPINQMPHLRRRRCLLHEGAGDILEQADEIHFLLIVAANRVAGLLTYDCQDRHMIKARVVKAGYQVRSAGARGRDAYAEFA
jgi:hypothetical protein